MIRHISSLFSDAARTLEKPRSVNPHTVLGHASASRSGWSHTRHRRACRPDAPAGANVLDLRYVVTQHANARAARHAFATPGTGECATPACLSVWRYRVTLRCARAAESSPELVRLS